MKEIIEIRYQVSFDNQLTWRDYSVEKRYKKKEKDEYVLCDKFSILEDLAKLHFGDLRISRTFFNKTKVCIGVIDVYGDIVYTKRRFKRDAFLIFRRIERVIKPTTQWLIDNLSIEEINEYCEDRNIRWCLSIKGGK